MMTIEERRLYNHNLFVNSRPEKKVFNLPVTMLSGYDGCSGLGNDPVTGTVICKDTDIVKKYGPELKKSFPIPLWVIAVAGFLILRK